MKNPEKHLKKGHIVLLVMLALITIGYLVFVITRFSEHTTYIPFTGRVFRIDSEEVSGISITNSNNGGYTVIYKEREEIKKLVEALNAFRYKWWLPDPSIARGGWSYILRIDFNGETCSYEFSERYLYVRGICFVARNDRLDELTRLVQGSPEEIE